MEQFLYHTGLKFLYLEVDQPCSIQVARDCMPHEPQAPKLCSIHMQVDALLLPHCTPCGNRHSTHCPHRVQHLASPAAPLKYHGPSRLLAHYVLQPSPYQVVMLSQPLDLAAEAREWRGSPKTLAVIAAGALCRCSGGLMGPLLTLV